MFIEKVKPHRGKVNSGGGGVVNFNTELRAVRGAEAGVAKPLEVKEAGL